MTHELRTPLAVVRAYADLLADDPPLEGRESRDPIRRATRAGWHRSTLEQIERLDRLVDSILTSVRVVPDQPAKLVPTDVGGLVADVVGGLEPILHRHRLELAPGPLDAGARGPAEAPPDRRASRRERREVRAAGHARSRSTGGWSRAFVRLGVTDEGPGIPAEWRDRIFEPYARRDTHTARGSGIGLYAAKRLGESMGARLWCEPADPTGARFVVALPAVVAV